MTKKNVYLLVAAVLVLSAVAEISGIHLHAPAWWPLPFGYDIFIGFVGCWILIFVSKIVMASLLQRDPNYYLDGSEDDYE